MSDGTLEYELPHGWGVLRFERDARERFIAYQQRRCLMKEAGGQLFASIETKLIQVIEATGPRKTDRRSIFGYVPDRAAERMEIAERYERDLHFVGDWHSHRQRHPLPSSVDIASMQDMVRHSRHGLTGFTLVIVGTGTLPRSLHVSFHTKTNWYTLALRRAREPELR